MILLPILILAAVVFASEDPDLHRDAYQIILGRGYPVQPHAVTTADGYILTVFRIPQPNAPVVLLLPGFTCTCVQLLIQSADTPLPFQLYQQGFEVWLANFRGTTYGNQHVSLSPANSSFWDYSFDQMAAFDLPAIIDTVLSVSSRSAITSLIGHSEGGTVGLAALSTYQSVFSRVDSFIALGPAIYMQHTKSPLLLALEKLTPMLKFLQVHRFVPSTDFLRSFIPEICSLWAGLCESAVCFTAGCDSLSSLEASRIPVLLSHYPDNSSVQDMDHWLQIKRTNQFRMYDYGSVSLNQAHYGTSLPTQYNISSIRVPTFIYGGSKDQFSVTADLDALAAELFANGANLQSYKSIPMGHGDFVWARDAYKVLYPELIEIVKTHVSS